MILNHSTERKKWFGIYFKKKTVKNFRFLKKIQEMRKWTCWEAAPLLRECMPAGLKKYWFNRLKYFLKTKQNIEYTANFWKKWFHSLKEILTVYLENLDSLQWAQENKDPRSYEVFEKNSKTSLSALYIAPMKNILNDFWKKKKNKQ